MTSEPVSAPGKTYLQVVGIFFIAFGSVSIVLSIHGLFNAGYLDATLPTASGMSWGIYYIMLLLGALFRVTLGVMGVAYRTRLEKAALLKILGILFIGYSILYMFLSSMIVYGYLADRLGLALAIGLIIPALFIIGAHKNHVAYKEKQT